MKMGKGIWILFMVLPHPCEVEFSDICELNGQVHRFSLCVLSNLLQFYLSNLEPVLHVSTAKEPPLGQENWFQSTLLV